MLLFCRELNKDSVFQFDQLCGGDSATRLDQILSAVGVESKARFSTTLQMVGVILGAALSGQLSDLYGRRKVKRESELQLELFHSDRC